MQEFNITGKTTVTAEIKAQMDNSPLALPPPSGYVGEVQNFETLKEATEDTTDSFKTNTADRRQIPICFSYCIINLSNLFQ